MSKSYVRKPMFVNGQWVVEVTQDRSPLAKVIETIPAGSTPAAAWQTYRQVMKDKGLML